MAGYQRILTIPANLVVEAMLRGEKNFFTEKGSVSINSTRLKTYMKGLVCVHCDREGNYFAMERHTSSLSKKFHLNLYHLRRPGACEIMMTSDHILAKFNGGGNELENRQPMCCICNSWKGSYATVEEGKNASKVAREKNRPKKLARLESSITYCIGMVEKNDLVKNWSNILRINVTEYMRQERILCVKSFNPFG